MQFFALDRDAQDIAKEEAAKTVEQVRKECLTLVGEFRPVAKQPALVWLFGARGGTRTPVCPLMHRVIKRWVQTDL